MKRVLPLLALLLAACASGPPEVPYPAFIQVDELDDVFMATLRVAMRTCPPVRSVST